MGFDFKPNFEFIFAPKWRPLAREYRGIDIQSVYQNRFNSGREQEIDNVLLGPLRFRIELLELPNTAANVSPTIMVFPEHCLPRGIVIGTTLYYLGRSVDAGCVVGE